MKFKGLVKACAALMLSAALMVSTPLTASAAGIQGIDVSKYQGGINWAAVAQSGITYTFIKVGSTNTGIDPYFAANVKGAQAAGIRTGVYIYSYATTVEAAIQEAQLVVQWIEGYNINFPVAFDIEDKTQKGLDANTCTAMANAFASVINQAGYTPILYTYTNFYKSHFTSALACDKWIAQYADHNDIAGWQIWQYSSGGAVPGVNGRVDMNVAVKDYTAFIPQVGLLDLGQGNVFFYNNFRKQYGWVDIAGVKYHTDPATGLVTTGWFADETGAYYFLPGAANAVTGFNTIDKGIYYFNEAAQLQTGWIDLGGNTFLFNPAENGKLYTGWWNDVEGVRYLDATDGHLVKGLNAIDKDVYYFNEKGFLQVGWVTLDKITYMFNPLDGGKLYKGWWNDATGVYYLDPTDAHRVTGLAAIDGAVYYFNEQGQMQVGVVKVNGATFFFGADGKMQTGMQTIGDGIFYFGENGAMVTGSFATPEGIYYAGKDGKLVFNQVITIDKKPYLFGADGKLVVNQLVQVGNMYYQTDAAGIVVAQAPATPAQ
ncbi:GH25 family lysozyme [Pseudobutyrivibrio xylanivorans]|uniref:Lyzozyme M1 (1,4-beta-N-acetylmuramidase), GH25 family n=1 Tax=Pseudobutyrivibrio xylanivorans TaxID=185007 RepID=A0A1G5RRJ0_PSEXY|nr:GH25 family lysozyme [Pseudobutyrivibrio xylanivorans]SCZ76715.1 Lyzozyme M1 (1,4-beta-N-acetylmuramidase), GH25 family [Pseudobutyrivibrio xylanivorans]